MIRITPPPIFSADFAPRILTCHPEYVTKKKRPFISATKSFPRCRRVTQAASDNPSPLGRIKQEFSSLELKYLETVHPSASRPGEPRRGVPLDHRRKGRGPSESPAQRSQESYGGLPCVRQKMFTLEWRRLADSPLESRRLPQGWAQKYIIFFVLPVRRMRSFYSINRVVFRDRVQV
jgi:hypothetical protein